MKILLKSCLFFLFFVTQFSFAEICRKQVTSDSGVTTVKWGCPLQAHCGDEAGLCVGVDQSFAGCKTYITDGNGNVSNPPANSQLIECSEAELLTNRCQVNGLNWVCDLLKSECDSVPGVCITRVSGQVTGACEAEDATGNFFTNLEPCGASLYVSGLFNPGGATATYSPIASANSPAVVQENQYPAGWSCDFIRSNILTIPTTSIPNASNGLNGCEGTVNGERKRYLCPAEYPYCSAAFGVCYREVGVFCQAEEVTCGYYQNAEASCEDILNNGRDFTGSDSPDNDEDRDEENPGTSPEILAPDAGESDDDPADSENSKENICTILVHSSSETGFGELMVFLGLALMLISSRKK